jgi:RNA polymerase sigma-70 factor, ECF subfamily
MLRRLNSAPADLTVSQQQHASQRVPIRPAPRSIATRPLNAHAPSTSLSLLERVQSRGDQEAWRRFVELYTPLLSLWAKRIGMQAADAADLAQDVLLLLLAKLPDFDLQRDGSFRAWLRRVTVNRWRERTRRKQPVAASGLVDEPAEPAPEFWEREFGDLLMARALYILRSRFDDNVWRAFWETAVEKRRAREVAAELGVSEAAVYVAKSRVLAKLRQELAGMWE